MICKKQIKNEYKERILEFIKQGIGQGSFEKVVGISNGYINNNKGTIGSDILNNIVAAYQNLNLYWLITGQGEMLKGEEKQNNETVNSLLVLNPLKKRSIMP